MEISQILDALTASFFALLGIWAGAVRRHWFLRMAAVSGFLLVTLLLPAYGLVIEFGLQMAIIATVVAAARGGASWRPRWSMETALLLTVVAAVAFAILGSLPKFTAFQWLGMLGIGVLTALFALVCLWLVYGGARLRRRIIGGAVAFAVLIVLLHFGQAVQYALSYSNTRAGWLATFRRYYTPDYLPTWLQWTSKSVGLGIAAMLATLLLARASGWFPTAERAAQPTTTLANRFARLGLGAMFAAIGLPLLVVFYQLLVPPPLPAPALPAPNGYTDFVAAGMAMPADALDVLNRRVSFRSLPLAELRRIDQSIRPVIEGIESGLSKECRVTSPFADRSSPERQRELEAIGNCSLALLFRNAYLQKKGDPALQVRACLQELRFSDESSRGGGVDAWDPLCEGLAAAVLRSLLGSLDAKTCRIVAREVADFDRQREPYAERQATQAHIDRRSDWETRLNQILASWSGGDPHPMNHWNLRCIAETRLLCIEAALQAYVLEHGHPPENVGRLTPDYLAAIPDDPFGAGTMKYIRQGSRYKVYSNSFDGDDDRGTPETANLGAGDIVFQGPQLHPLWTQLAEGASAGLEYMRSITPPKVTSGAEP
ncbi:MAG TPA: hypothetical protein VF175_15410 [Lacipirellula sp.]